MGIFPAELTPEEINLRFLPALEKELGVRVIELGERSLTAEFKVVEKALQPYGIMHGGISCLLGESLGSMAGNFCLMDSEKIVVGQSLQAFHLRPVRLGANLEARAEPLHLGMRTQIWDINIRERLENKAIARITLTLAVIDKFK